MMAQRSNYIEGNKTIDVRTHSLELACERHCILYVACMTVNHGAEFVNTVTKTGSESSGIWPII